MSMYDIIKDLMLYRTYADTNERTNFALSVMFFMVIIACIIILRQINK